MKALILFAALATVAWAATWTFWRIKTRPQRIAQKERDLGMFMEGDDD